MINFDRNPAKSSQELLIEKKQEEYRKKFGVDYHVTVGFKVDIIKEIDECIKNNKPQKDPKMSDDLIY